MPDPGKTVPHPSGRSTRLAACCLMLALGCLGASSEVAAAPAPAATAAAARPAPAEAPRIRDNLFLLEEAYNQEPGVIQHIQSFQIAPRTREWLYTFTEEWPVPTDRNQVSVTLPVLRQADPEAVGVGDLLVNYRLQVAGMGGQGWLAIAPRLSLVLPTGDGERGLGRGSIGIQVNLPISMELGRWFVAHLNAGFTVTPRAEMPAAAAAPGKPEPGRTDTTVDSNLGAALVWQPLRWFNLLVETLYTTTEAVEPAGLSRSGSVIVNPGVRFAIDVKRLQIVPGISAPLEVLQDFEPAVLGYLSLEHPAW